MIFFKYSIYIIHHPQNRLPAITKRLKIEVGKAESRSEHKQLFQVISEFSRFQKFNHNFPSLFSRREHQR